MTRAKAAGASFVCTFPECVRHPKPSAAAELADTMARVTGSVGATVRYEHVTPAGAVVVDEVATTMAPTTYPVRISRAAADFLSGTGAWQAKAATAANRETPEAVELMTRIRTAKARKDGSVTVRLTDDEAAALNVYAMAWRAGTVDNLGVDGPGEYNSARALCAALWVIVNGGTE